MGGLIALSILSGWIFLSVFLARRIPGWLRIQRYMRSASIICFFLVLIAPFAQDIVGMWQFDRLCKERAVVWVGPETGQVRRAKDAGPRTVNLSGYWIPIEAHPVAYIDADTDKPFYTYEVLLTKGGFIGQIALLGGLHSCEPKQLHEMWMQLNLDNLLKAGK